MTDPTLTDLLQKLSDAVDESRAARLRFEAHFAAQVQELWDDSAERRDELHAVANRLEALTSFVCTEPAEVAEKIVRLRDADA